MKVMVGWMVVHRVEWCPERVWGWSEWGRGRESSQSREKGDWRKDLEREIEVRNGEFLK